MITAIEISVGETFLTFLLLDIPLKKLEGWNLKLTHSGRAMLKILWDVKIDFKDIGFLSFLASLRSHIYSIRIAHKKKEID